MGDAFIIGSREAIILLAGAAVLLGTAFVAGRVLRSLRHGFSIRLQLFLAIFATATLSAAVIGFWAVERIQWRAEVLMATNTSSSEVLVELLRDFGPKMAFLVTLLGAAAAAAAFLLGRGLAGPLEKLTRVADGIARGERPMALPPATGREVRRLTAAFAHMRRALEDRHHIERFVADLSHELKNPVSAVRAATEVLLEGAADDPEARARFLGRIDEAARRLEALLQDLLALSRLEAHGVDESRGNVSLADEVRAAIREAGPRLEARSLTVQETLAPVRLRGDAPWLRRAVDNLLANAIRYSPEGGTIRVDLRVDGEHARIRVADEGPGVAPALKARIFQRFVTDRAHVGGTGLGLAIVRSVAELHGGDAQLVESERGACFEISLRLA
ncbi:MAG: HAMP domain-containing protein [Myxococcales bacterium]|nr:HAMP domain-containing protein [Myxococcales bacterium]